MLLKKRAIILCLLCVVLIGAMVSSGWLLLADLPELSSLREHVLPPTTQIYDRHGRLLYEIMDPGTGKQTQVVLDKIPMALRQATIATEDATFYKNPGVDLIGILRALSINFRGGEVLAGGSTITQQLARNLLLSPGDRMERTLWRKLRESVLAWRMARQLSKDEILELYLNQTYYGNLAYGVQAAARAYYGKNVSELDLAECALLAGIPQAPALYNPLEHPEDAIARQRTVLELMHKAGYIDEGEMKLAGQETLHYATVPFPIRAPHFVMYVRAILQRTYGLDFVYSSGLRVHTTLDLDLQTRAGEISQYHLTQINKTDKGVPGADAHNVALIALDPDTGEILAMLGSPDYFDTTIDGAVNCTLALRQPGSAIKPLTYAAALSMDYTPATMLVDVRTSFPTREGTPYVPVNYDHRFHGPVLLREALGSSMNVIAVKVLQHVGVGRLAQLARDLGITTFASDRFGLALTLGGGEVKLLELTAAYAAFANGGKRVTPVAVKRIEDSAGNIIFQQSPPAKEQVLDSRLAYLITDILADDSARIPAFGQGSVLKISRPAAVKTGTTTDWRDNWTVGYTPNLAVGVWIGNADNSPMNNITGITGAAPIWHDFMETALAGTPVRVFERPEGLTVVEICPLSGQLAGPRCPHRRQELFITGTELPTECQMHRAVRIDATTGLLATDNCPQDTIAERTYVFYPPEAAAWAEDEGLTIPPQQSCWLHQPLLADAGESRDSHDGNAPIIALELSQPHAGTVFQLSSTLPRADQRIEIAAHTRTEVLLRELRFLVDDEMVASLDQGPYRVMWPLSPGQHRLQVIGYTPDGARLESQVVEIKVTG